MSKLESFSLVTGIIGLVADIIGVATYLTGMWKPATSANTQTRLPSTYGILSASLIIYGWLAVSWALIRSSFVKRETPEWRLSDNAYRAVLGIGLLLLPLIIGWWVVVDTEAESSLAESQARTLLGYLPPVLLSYSAVGSLLLAVLVSLMPMIHTDMPEESIEGALRRPFHLLENFLMRGPFD